MSACRHTDLDVTIVLAALIFVKRCLDLFNHANGSHHQAGLMECSGVIPPRRS